MAGEWGDERPTLVFLGGSQSRQPGLGEMGLLSTFTGYAATCAVFIANEWACLTGSFRGQISTTCTVLP